MSEDRKKLSPEQLSILVDAIKQDPTLSGLKGRKGVKSQYFVKWTELTKRLNSVDSGSQKSMTKWQQAWRDLKANVKKKAVKSANGTADLTDLELQVYNLDSVATAKPESSPGGIDISTIAEVDPLSSEESSADESKEEKPECSPNSVTVYSNGVKNETGKRPNTENDGAGTVKRQKIQLFPDPNLTPKMAEVLSFLTTLQSASVEATKRNTQLLEESLLERAHYIEQHTHHLEQQTQCLNQILQVVVRIADKFDTLAQILERRYS